MSAAPQRRPISATSAVDRGFVGQVGRVREARAAASSSVCRERLEIVFAHIGQAQLGAGLAEGFRDPAADHAAGAGDDHALALEVVEQ